jgi:hypothetical protein
VSSAFASPKKTTRCSQRCSVYLGSKGLQAF